MGTALAGHTLRTAVDLAKSMNWSYMLLFVDLTKAFDMLVRETVMGWSDDVPPESRLQRLLDLGLSAEKAQHLKESIDREGGALARAGCAPGAIDMLRSLHSGAWFNIDGCSQPVVTRRGGRQGCKLGPVVFNTGYELPLARIRNALASHGLAMRVSKRAAMLPWAGAPAVAEIGQATLQCDDAHFGKPALKVSHGQLHEHLLLNLHVKCFRPPC